MQKGQGWAVFSFAPYTGTHLGKLHCCRRQGCASREKPQPFPPAPALEGDTVSWGKGTIQGGLGKHPGVTQGEALAKFFKILFL